MPGSTITYTMTVSNSVGTDHCSTTITVTTPPPPPVTPAPVCTLSANPTSITSGGASTLSWTTSNASTVLISTIGAVGTSGSRTVVPSQSTTYDLTAYGSDGAIVHCQTTITVVTPQAPACTLSVSPGNIQQGSSATLSWSTANANSFSIDNGIGQVSVNGGSRTVSPSQTTTYTGTATGPGGTVHCSATVTVTIAAPAPVCTLSASPTSILAGGTSTITWTTNNATSVTLNQGLGAYPGTGQTVVQPNQTTTYVLTATGAGGTVTCETTITIVTPQAPACTLSVVPTSILQGSAATLAWTTHNASNVSITNVGSVSTSGSTTVAPSITTTYVLTASGSGGTVNCSTTLVVVPPQPNAPVCTLSASPNNIQQGGASTLSWTTSNATSVSIDNGIGGVATSGGRNVAPSQSTTYTLTATGPGGTVNCSAPVTVSIPSPAPTCTLSANPSSIRAGDVTTLSWNTTNATSFIIDQGVGSVNVPSGSLGVNPGGSRTYTGTATGPGGTVTCATSVSTNSSRPGPSCTLNVSPSTIYEGEDARLRWDSTNVNQVRINQGIGYVNDNGSRTVSPNDTGTFTYEGTFYGDNGNTITCSATLRVRAEQQHIVLDSLPLAGEQPLSYVYLANMPYTGLDLGPVGTAMYWLMLILWSLAVAYLVLFGAVPFALRRVGIGSEFNHVVHEEAAAEAVHPAPTPVMHSVAPVAAPARTFSSYDGFKSLSESGALTVDDIVKGLSRESDDSHLLPQAKVPAATATPVPAEQGASQAFATNAGSVAADVHQDIPGFLAALVNGEKDTVFGIIRDITKAGGDAQAFITHAVMALDDAYRAKTDGTPVHPEVARVCENCAPNFLEKLITSLSTAVDSSYSAGVTGVKLAVTRALAIVNG